MLFADAFCRRTIDTSTPTSCAFWGHTCSKHAVGPRGHQVLRLGRSDGHRIRRVEFNTVRHHVILKVLPHRNVADHRNLAEIPDRIVSIRKIHGSLLNFSNGENIVLWSVQNHKNSNYIGSGRLVLHTFTLVVAVGIGRQNVQSVINKYTHKYILLLNQYL